MRWLFLTALAVGCTPEDEAPEVVLLDAEEDEPLPTDTSTPPEEATCGPQELCARSLQECQVALSPDQCMAFYDDPGACADMDAYVACNCDCIEQPDCDGYFACGELCFLDHC